MKKILVALVLSAILLLACGCGEVGYEQLQQMASQSYGFVGIDGAVRIENKDYKFSVIVSSDGDMQEIDYSYEQRATFDEVDGEIVAPDNFIVTKTGKITKNGDKIVDQNGESLDGSQAVIVAFGFLFQESLFTDATFGSSSFTASVTNPAAFVGSNDFAGTDMKVQVTFADNAFKTMNLQYSLTNATVNATYTFVK